MANNYFERFIPLYAEFSEELHQCILQYFQLVLGYYLGYSFYNYQSFLDWSITICLMHFIITKVNAELLWIILPESFHLLLYKNILAELLSMGLICFLTQQSLSLLIFSRVLYIVFSFYSILFSHSILESIGIAYYLNSLWFLLPVFLNFLVSSLYLLDLSFEMHLIHHFFEIPVISSLFDELGVKIENLSKYKQDQYGQANPYYSLIARDEEFLKQLKQRILKSHTKSYLKKLLHQFKMEIKELYLNHPAQVYKDNHMIKLPLEWNDFKNLLKQHPDLKQKMFHAYHQNVYHTIWRLLQYKNPWLAYDRHSEKHHYTYQQAHYQEMLLLLWSKAKMQKQEDRFIREIAKIYRHRNHSHIKYHFFAKDFDNFEADMPAPIEDFHHYVFKNLELHSDLDLLTHYEIKKHWLEEIKIYWRRYLDSLNKNEFFELRYLWKEILSNNKVTHLQHFKVMDLDETFKNDFIKKMKIQYGKKWKEFHHDYVNQLFIISHVEQTHVEKYAIAFSNLMKKYFHEEIPARFSPTLRLNG